MDSAKLLSLLSCLESVKKAVLAAMFGNSLSRAESPEFVNLQISRIPRFLSNFDISRVCEIPTFLRILHNLRFAKYHVFSGILVFHGFGLPHQSQAAKGFLIAIVVLDAAVADED